MEGEYGEDLPSPELKGEGGTKTTFSSPRFTTVYPIKEKKLNFEEASMCLNTLGKDESGVRYAYLMITATERKLTDVSVILNFKHVLFLDLSGNFLNLESLQILFEMPFLIYLKVERNRIESAALNPMYYLQALLLNRNQITETCDISQPLLECLELDDNLIYTAQFDTQRLSCLKELTLKGNHLLDLSGTFPPTLEKLYVGENKIRKLNIDCLTLKNLNTLHLRGNSIRKLNGLTETLTNLTYLNLRDNQINKLRQFRKLQSLPKLETLIMSGNPVSGEDKKRDDEDEREDYGEDFVSPRDKTRIPLLVLLPNLKRINKELVTLEEREVAEERKRKIQEDIFEELSSEDETEMATTTEFTTDYTTDNEEDNSEEHVDEVEGNEEIENDENKGENEDVKVADNPTKLGNIQETDQENTNDD